MDFINFGGFNFADIQYDNDNVPHITHEVMCVKCYKRWIAVHPVETLLKDLQCPQCKKQGYAIATGQIFDFDKENDL